MNDYLNASIVTLAQTGDPGAALSQGAPTASPTTTGTTAPSNGGQQPQQPGGLSGMIMLIPLAIIAVMVISQIGGAKKERKRRDAMLAGLARHDRVVTIGGIIGSVVDVRDDEVVLKVDENTNTKMKFTRSSIQQVLKASGEAPAAADARVEVKTRGEKASV